MNTEEIKRRRERKKLTMAAAAKAAGLKTIQRWSDIENGRHPNPRVLTLAAVAGVLGCKVDQLLVK